ncbi:MAG: hypothetical protein A3E83_06035 [Gammaproteobacteria bacterium RIFCSPHIGHO2_12_FULL_41_20]|nr:MAG: hypothetical protein A3E83_06035 [Gammaproteobacteria bacterium RIFCSPHIGHO2_12_FULL_41_20]
MAWWRRYFLPFFIFSSVAIFVLMPLASNTWVPNNLDYLSHISAIIHARWALLMGQFPLRAITNSDGFLYPLFQFYSPSSYTVAGIIHRWGVANPFLAYKMTVWGALVVGGIYMSRLSYWLTLSRPIAMLSGLVYLTAPYMIIVINHIGAFNETIALGLLPAVLFYTLRCADCSYNLKGILPTALVWYLLATTHFLTFLVTSFSIVILLIMKSSQSSYHWRNVTAVIASYGFGCLLAIWYLAPIGFFSRYFVANRTFNNADYFYAYSPSLMDLLSPQAATANDLPSGMGRLMDSIAYIHPNIGLPILIAVSISIYAVLYRVKPLNRPIDNWLKPLLLLFFLMLFLTWSPFNFWQWLPPSLLFLQYSWRLLGQITWIGALLFAWCLSWFFQGKITKNAGIIIAFLSVLSVGTWFVSSNLQSTRFSEILPLIKDSDFYVIDAGKSPQFVNMVDNLLIDSVRFHQELDLRSLSPIIIPVALLQGAHEPVLSVSGHVFGAMVNQTVLLSANGVTVQKFLLMPGKFQWHISLRTILSSLKHVSILSLQFSVQNCNGRNCEKHAFAMPLDEIILEGFLSKKALLQVQQVQPYCQQQSNMTCRLKVPANVHLLELPVFYYPQLLTITLNNKVVPYFSVFYRNRLLTALIPEAGDNLISVQFRGLLWANYISAFAWQCWILLLVFVVLRSAFYKC